MTSPPLTAKAQRTRAQLLDVALGLFATQGYESTTMRQIAQHSGRSTGLIYRYFDRKEALVMALYERLANDMHQHVFEDLIGGGTLGARFGQVMRWRIHSLGPHKETLSAMFASMLDATTPLGVFSQQTAGVRTMVGESFGHVAREADDVPDSIDPLMMGDVLYMAHLLIVLVWLLDRTEESASTHQAIKLAETGLTHVWPILKLVPGTSHVLSQLSALLEGLEHRDAAS